MVSCEKELGTWTVRMNGVFIFQSVWESTARRLAMNLQKAIAKGS